MILTTNAKSALLPCSKVDTRSLLLSSQGVLIADSPATTRKTAEGPPLPTFQHQEGRVCFATDHHGSTLEEIFYVLPRSEFTQSEKDAAWLTRRDLQVMDTALRMDVMRSSFRHHQTDHGENLLRGLEWKTFEGIQQLSTNRKKSVQSVLNEQQWQNRKGVYQPVRIATAYQRAAAHCKVAARKVALEDEALASKILHSQGGFSEDTPC